jgi:hypothetical protein
MAGMPDWIMAMDLEILFPDETKTVGGAEQQRFEDLIWNPGATETNPGATQTVVVQSHFTEDEEMLGVEQLAKCRVTIPEPDQAEERARLRRVAKTQAQQAAAARITFARSLLIASSLGVAFKPAEADEGGRTINSDGQAAGRKGRPGMKAPMVAFIIASKISAYLERCEYDFQPPLLAEGLAVEAQTTATVKNIVAKHSGTQT